MQCNESRVKCGIKPFQAVGTCNVRVPTWKQVPTESHRLGVASLAEPAARFLMRHCSCRRRQIHYSTTQKNRREYQDAQQQQQQQQDQQAKSAASPFRVQMTLPGSSRLKQDIIVTGADDIKRGSRVKQTKTYSSLSLNVNENLRPANLQ